MNPFIILLLLFVAAPLLDLYLLIRVGGLLGALPTIGLVAVTAVLGVWVVRIQGFVTLRRVQSTLAQGGTPAIPMLEGLLLLLAGALLILPGPITDSLGLLLLIPLVRRGLVKWALARLLGRLTPGGGAAPPPRDVIEGEYRREDP